MKWYRLSVETAQCFIGSTVYTFITPNVFQLSYLAFLFVESVILSKNLDLLYTNNLLPRQRQGNIYNAEIGKMFSCTHLLTGRN
jgi:hypothetical protein